MIVNIEIHYFSHAGRVLQRGPFKVTGSIEQTALNFLRKLENTIFILQVEKIIYNGDIDITEKVLELKNKPLDDV